MTVIYYQHDGRWRWRLTNDFGTINTGSIQSYRLKFMCRRNFKKRYMALRRKRPDWPEYSAVINDGCGL